ncbi:hypothetical protein [Mycobacterium decipiens]|uniref:Uncharacterized protein n=1 Tax=Mycobacterium decipiens TaxID=1430326 RepID=A0A1X2LQF1_9MYCO|nr:hypothetical protein [Mycobacterium decipiens]OSC36589.1 hypothetical protein B8W66_22670 [Mycobacterium decipiens]
MTNSEGIGFLKLECPQGHPVGRILKQVPHQLVQYDPGASVGPRRHWPQEGEQHQFKTRCPHCDKPVGDSTATLQNKLSELLADASEAYGTATVPYL